MIVADIPTQYESQTAIFADVVENDKRPYYNTKKDREFLSKTNIGVIDTDYSDKRSGYSKPVEEKTSSAVVIERDKTNDSLLNHSNESMIVTEAQNLYSADYIKFNTSALVQRVQLLLSEWSSKGTLNSISEISQIKKLIEDNSIYLEEKSETRLLLGCFETIFDNDNWQSITKAQLEILIKQLSEFKKGNVKVSTLENFVTELWRSDIL